MLRGRAIGLRPRLIAALLLTSAVTLIVAAVALLPPLESRLRADQLDTMVALAASTRSSFTRLEREEVRAGSPELGRLARRLSRRTGARVAILDGHGATLVATDSDAQDRFPDAQVAIARGHAVRGRGRGEEGDELQVAVPVRAGGQRIAIALRRSSHDARFASQVVQHAFLPAALAALVIAGALGIAISGRLLSRLKRLRATALAVAEAGPVAEVRADETRDEVGDLGRALATMQRNLRSQEEARRTFVATASHELRTPLTSLQVMLELLDSDNGDSGDTRAQVRRALEQTRRLASLASNLLDLSHIDAGVPLRSEPVDVSEVCRAVAAEFRGPGARVSLDASAQECWARADPGALAQVLRILLDNARRVSPADSTVSVAVTRANGSAEIAVQDEGPGVAAGEEEAIFERFRRGSAAPDGGFGLGLAIGRKLAERMQGALDLAGEGPGARFILRLPAEPGPLG